MKFTSQKLHLASLFLQGLILSVHVVLLFIILFVIEFGWLFVILFLLTLFLGVYQWGISASLNVIVYKNTVARWRWLHWFGSVAYIILASILNMMFRNDTIFVIFLIAVPHVIGYLYFWADYQEYSKKYSVR